MKYDVVIIGAGPGGIFSAYELIHQNKNLKIAVFEEGYPLEKRHCPIDGKKVPSCIKCPTCAIMSGFGGAGAFSDGKYNITNNFGGTLYEYIGKETAIELMNYVDEINVAYGGQDTKMYSTAGTKFKKLCIQNKLKLLDASVRHLGTDINYVVLENLYAKLKEHVDFHFNTPVERLEVLDDEKYTGKITPITTEIAENIYHRAFVDHSLMNECENGVNDTRRIWWVQAETVIGFLNRYQKDPEKKEYLQAAEDEWNYIKTYMLDPRDGSEWFWYVKEDHTPGDGPIVEPWKCPYHNGRMCMEVIRRMKNAE